MKKYSSYFNKRYFPEPEDAEEEEPLSGESLTAQEAQPEPPAPPVVPPAPPKPVRPPEPQPPVQDAFAFPAFDDEPEPLPEPEPEPEPVPAPAPAPVPEPVRVPEPPAMPAFSIPDVGAPAQETETTVISESATINGELTVSGNIKMYGKIKGNLTAAGNLEIAGKVIGNLTGNDIELNHCELKGDINASGFTFMDKESIMIGNLNSQDVTLDGKVKGDVSATHKVYVRSNAVIVGNVRAAVIAIDEGAALQGQVIIASKDGDEDGMEIGGGDDD